MESPEGWTLLTSSLSVADLKDAETSWRFLRIQHLVIDSARGAQQLQDAIAVEVARGRITGGSLAHRVAGQLVEAGLVLASADSLDPFGELAAQRWRAFRKDEDERAV